LVRGKVVSRSTGELILGSDVLVTSPEGLQMGVPEGAVPGELDISFGEDDGTFAYHICEGPIVVVVSHPDYAPVRLTGLTAQAEVPLDLEVELDSGSGVFGWLTFRGRPVAGATVTVAGEGGSARGALETELDGYFAMQGLPQGAYELQVEAQIPGMGQRKAREKLGVSKGSFEYVQVELAGVRLSGRVLSRGKPASAYLEFETRDATFRATETNEDGRYSIHLPSGGAYLVSVHPEEGEPVEGEINFSEDEGLSAQDIEVGDLRPLD
jgi:hypothetical protein